MGNEEFGYRWGCTLMGCPPKQKRETITVENPVPLITEEGMGWLIMPNTYFVLKSNDLHLKL